MDSDSWSGRLASASRRYQLGFLSPSGRLFNQQEYACPFCSDYFDIVSLCCHLDEDHPMDTINGVCPVCAVKVSSDMLLTLFSFISPMAAVELFISESSLCGEETGSTAKKTLGQSLPERNVEKTLLSEEDHREKLKQSEFVQGVFSSMMLDDDL
uniref:Di19 zinc-binding domain-containing protein n=1 Tax=Brassica oleracea var. oleracea TaxID=109376 RepID=A0A0D3E160_BRAOL